ncbi:MAG: hypothetical protein ACLQOO_34660 [Terriglobia bacterium]
MFDRLDCLQKWFEDQVCPVEYPEAMRELYGECPSRAGESIRLLFIDFFGSEGEVAAEKAAVLERQVREHTRLLLQLKTARSQWREPVRGTTNVLRRQRAGASLGTGIVRTIRHRNRTRHGGRRAACETNRLSIGRPVSRLIRQRLHYAGGRRRREGHGNGA